MNYMKIPIYITFLFICHFVKCSAQCDIANIQNGTIEYNKLDSNCVKVGCWAKFDCDSIIFSITNYSNQKETPHQTKFFLKNGSEIKKYTRFLNPIASSKISKKVEERFNKNIINPNHGHGTFIYSIIFTPKGTLEEIRVLQSVHKEIREELYRSINLLKDDVIILTEEQNQKYFIGYFTLKF